VIFVADLRLPFLAFAICVTRELICDLLPDVTSAVNQLDEEQRLSNEEATPSHIVPKTCDQSVDLVPPRRVSEQLLQDWTSQAAPLAI
jgi:hypothetical protein